MKRYPIISFNSNIGDQASMLQHQRLELEIKELETKLELEQTARSRMDTQISQLKEEIEKLNHECNRFRAKVGLFSHLVKNEGSRFQIILLF